MKSPITNKEMKLITERRSFTFRKENFEIFFQCFLCEDSGEKFTTTDLDEVNYTQVYNQYREKHHLVFPQEVIEIRKKYELPAKKMSELLGFGSNQYGLYEKGEIPNSSNSTVIRLAQNPKVFKSILEDKEDILTQKDYKKLLQKIEVLIEREEELTNEKVIENYIFGEKNQTKFTGYKKPNWNKIANIIVFFSKEITPLKTVLNKLMFYADSLHYKKTGFSISGLSYKAIQYGNVPENFELIFSKAERENFIIRDYKTFKNKNQGEIFVTNKAVDLEVFDQFEAETLKNVLDFFKNKTREEIVEICHKEISWIENEKQKNNIDYNYAFEMKAFT